jgi:hypothetical protein
MQNESPSIVQRWSTLDVAPARALDHYAQALTEAVDPMRVASRNTGSFHAAVASCHADSSISLSIGTPAFIKSRECMLMQNAQPGNPKTAKLR